MAYSYLTFAQAVAALAGRLQDTGFVYWNQPDELLNAIIESVRFHQLLTASYKQKIAFPTAADVLYYDLPNLTGATNGAAIAYTATDVEVANNVLAALLESALAPGWVGTGQFTFAQLQVAMQNRLNRFLDDTGCRVAQQTIGGPSPTTDIAPLPEGTLDVRRAAWIPLPQTTPPANPAYPLGRLDEWAEQAYVPGAELGPVIVRIEKDEVLRGAGSGVVPMILRRRIPRLSGFRFLYLLAWVVTIQHLDLMK